MISVCPIREREREPNVQQINPVSVTSQEYQNIMFMPMTPQGVKQPLLALVMSQNTPGTPSTMMTSKNAKKYSTPTFVTS